jgi:hypothetical protein
MRARYEDGFTISVDVAAADNRDTGLDIDNRKYRAVYDFFKGKSTGAPQPASRGGEG